MAGADDPAWLRPESEAIDLDLVEVDAAVAMVDRGLATRVRLVGLTFPERVAATALARAQAASIGFHVERSATWTTLTIGPRDADGPSR